MDEEKKVKHAIIKIMGSVESIDSVLRTLEKGFSILSKSRIIKNDDGKTHLFATIMEVDHP